MQAGGRKRTDPDYGRGQAAIRAGDEVLLDEAAMTARILAVFRAPDYRPPTLPAVATQLLELSHDADVDFADVVALLERDAVLTARVLHLTRSPIYGGRVPIRSLPEALRRLGLRTLRDLVLDAVMNLRVFRAAAYTEAMERVARHSRATAHLARLVAARTLAEAAGELGFLCGLLHDVGVAGTLIVLGEGARGQRRPDLRVLWPVLDRAHEEAGARMAALWDLPPAVSGVLGHHHHPEAAAENAPLAAVVCVAEALADDLGRGLFPCASERQQAGAGPFHEVDATAPAVRARAHQTLGLDDAARARLREEAARLLEQVEPVAA